MTKHKSIHDYIDQYHNGEISESDFQKRLTTDEEVKQAYLLYQQDLEIIRAAAKQQLKGKALKLLAEQNQKPGRVFSLRKIISVAAAIALLVASFFIFQKMQQPIPNADLFASHFELPDPEGERNTTNQSKIWNEAMIAYSNQDFEKSIELLTPLIKQDDFLYQERGKLYLGLSYLMEDQNQKAITLFEDINVESSYVQDAEWYRALALLKTDNLAEAKKAFQKIADQAKHFKKAEALEILKNLK